MNESGSRSGAFLPSVASAAAAAAAAAASGSGGAGGGGLGSPSRSSASGGDADAYADLDELLFSERYPGKLCALCNLGERSMLGQGEMVKYRVPSGVNIITVIKDRRKALGIGALPEDKEREAAASSAAATAAALAERSPKLSISSLNARRKGRKMTSGDAAEPTDELENVGFVEEPDHNLLFETTGK